MSMENFRDEVDDGMTSGTTIQAFDTSSMY